MNLVPSLQMAFSGMYQIAVFFWGFPPTALNELSLRWNSKYNRKQHHLTDVGKETRKHHIHSEQEKME